MLGKARAGSCPFALVMIDSIVTTDVHSRIASFAALTAAGICTESGLPDRRGPQRSLRALKPMTREFVLSAENPRRYWARTAMPSRTPATLRLPGWNSLVASPV